MNLNILNAANRLRLPQFKNKHGEAAHTQPDGSDWSRRMWLIALMGEVGELATANESQTPTERGKEAADVLIYLDIYMQRALDGMNPKGDTLEDGLIELIEVVGAMCEAHKKYVRGDLNETEYVRGHIGRIRRVDEVMSKIAVASFNSRHTPQGNAKGLNLAEFGLNKFNEVSNRVRSSVFISHDGEAVIDSSLTGD